MVSATHKRCAHHPCHQWFHSALCYCTLSIEIYKTATFGERIRRDSGLLSRPFLTRFLRINISWKSKALATKCIFQNYSQLLGICTRLVFKTAEEPFVPSVYENTLSISWEENNKRESKQASRRTSALSRLYYPLTSAIIISPSIMNMRDFVSWITRRRSTCL